MLDTLVFDSLIAEFLGSTTVTPSTLKLYRYAPGFGAHRHFPDAILAFGHRRALPVIWDVATRHFHRLRIRRSDAKDNMPVSLHFRRNHRRRRSRSSSGSGRLPEEHSKGESPVIAIA